MRFSRRLVACGLLIATVLPVCAAEKKAATSYFAYVGTYTREGKSRGIYTCRFDPDTGKMTACGLAAEIQNPTLLTVHPNLRFLYSVSAVKSGTVNAFSIDRTSGRLTLLNSVSSHGDGPTFVAVDKTGKYILVANYNNGSIASLPIGSDGKLGEAASVVQHKGSSVNQKRQAGPHAHFITLSPDNRFAIVADLGLDEVLVYRFDAANGALAPNDPPYAKVEPGAGPRHFAFSPDGRFGYVVNEMGSTVTAFEWDKTRGSLRNMKTVSALPKDFSGENTGAEIAVHPAGKFLYSSNRGSDSIAAFRIDSESGALTLLGQTSTEGKTPRFFTFDPTGRYLFAANQDSDNIVAFKVDPKAGRLTSLGSSVSIAAPVSLVFVPAS